MKHRGRLEIDSVVILKGEKNGLGKDMHYCWEDEKLPSLVLIIGFADHWEKGKASFFPFFVQAGFIFFVVVVTFYLCSSVTFSSFLVLCLFFLISHHHFMWAVKIQRSDRPLPWDFWASNHCSLHTYHHYNSFHPDHCRAPALTVMKAPPPNSPRNVPGFLLLVFYLNYILLMPSSSDSYHIWFHRCGVFFFL